MRSYGMLSISVQMLFALVITVIAATMLGTGVVEFGPLWSFLMMLPLIILWIRIVIKILQFSDPFE